jgi:hypothetical protein
MGAAWNPGTKMEWIREGGNHLYGIRAQDFIPVGRHALAPVEAVVPP